MGHAPFLEAGAIFLVFITLALVRLGRGAGGWHWAAAWCCLWSSGASNALAASYPLLGLLFPVLGTTFAVLLFTGSCVFAGRRIPHWLVPAAVLVAIGRMVLGPVAGEAIVQITGTLVIAASAFGGSWQVMRSARVDRRGWNLLLASSLPVVAVASCAFTYYKLTDPESWQGLFAWLTMGSLVGGVQVVALLGRVAQRSENQRAVLAAVLDAAPVGLALVRENGELVAPNQMFHKLVGTLASEERPQLATVLDGLRAALEEGDRPLLDGSSASRDVSQELRFRDGRRVLSSMWPVVEPGTGQTLGRLWRLVDVTDERQLQERLERARRLETLGGFAGGVAHDFNNQLTTVLGNSALLRDAVSGNRDAEEILEDLESSAEYCAKLTRDVLDFARRSPTRQETLDLPSLLPGIVRRASGRGAGAALWMEPDVPAILADAVSLERVVGNLVDNARTAVGTDGTVEVHVRRESADRVALEVRDDGPGIGDRERARIFDPFYTTKALGEGTGLGLAIVYGIVSMHGGEVRAESRSGGGTRMITTWPVAAPSPSTAKPERAP